MIDKLKFSSLLAPNDKTNLDEINYPLLASTKLDGIRILFNKGQIVTRSLKKLPNKQLNEKFEPIRKYTEINNCLLDGEIYTHGIPFQFIVSCAMTHDYNDKKSIKKWNELCIDHNFYLSREEVHKKLKFNCFDCVYNEDFFEKFCLRNLSVERICLGIENGFDHIMTQISQQKVNNKQEVEVYFEEVLSEGYEGAILRDPNGIYKCGRGTIKEGIIYKVKPWVTIDAQIVDVVQSTEVEKTRR